MPRRRPGTVPSDGPPAGAAATAGAIDDPARIAAAVGPGPRSARRERGSLSTEAIVAGALRLAAEHGMDALSMPKLAASLGIGVTSIYWYFAGKDALIDAMIEDAARRLHDRMAPEANGSWQDHAFTLFVRLHAIMQADDLLCDLLFMRGSRLGENALMHLWPQLEEGLRLMVDAGFSHDQALRNHGILSLHTRGAITLARQMARAGSAASAHRPVPPNLPHIARASRHQPIRGVTEETFRAQVRDIIAGMEARLLRETGR